MRFISDIYENTTIRKPLKNHGMKQIKKIKIKYTASPILTLNYSSKLAELMSVGLTALIRLKL